ncbi:MAG: hypothetical protein ISS49_06335, partial [Anaerolineae bacterium]|nr:hypothetical protein [Anaerolineae bacterium]
MKPNSQIWFVDGEARAATTVVEPVRFDLSVAVSFQYLLNNVGYRCL